ncbi:MAG: restriction endonuclease subunit S [Paludibacteraceae bacterium]|nr:restriction endonuclease subunit S [Paludibacteraceae bacterium]
MEWEIVRVDDVFDVINGFAFSSNDLMTDPQDNCWEVLKIGHISPNGGLRTQPKREYAIKTKKNSRYILQKGDIVMGMTDMKSNVRILGVPAIVDRSNHYALNQRVGCLRIKDTSLADNIFCYYQMGHSRFISDLRKTANSGVQVNLTTIGIRSTQLFLPPLSIQRRIASILSSYDNLIELNTRRIKLLEQMAENLYKEWFVRFRFPGHEKVEMENGLPKGWRYAKLEDVLSLKDSTRIPLSSIERSNMQKIYPYYGAASILDYVSDYLFDGVYLLLGEDGSVIDENGYPYIQYVWGKFWVNNHAHVIEKKGVYSVEFLYCMFKKMNIQSIVTGVAQPKISQGRLFNKKVIIPCDSIISLFDKQIQPIFAEIRQLTNQTSLLTRQRDLLLPRLMSGQLPTQ